MIVAASIRSLLRRRGRTGLALAGVTVSAALLLDMTMLASGLTRSFGTLIGVSGYALRVTPRGMLPFDSDATISGAAAVQARIEAVAGVSAVAPVLGAQLFQVLGDSAGPAVFTLGIAGDPRFQYSLISGRDPAPDEVVVSGAFAAAARVGLGDSLQLAPPADISMGTVRGARRYRVSGIADFIYDYEGQHTVAMPLRALQRATGQEDRVSLFGVAAAAGVDGDRLAGRIDAATPQVSALSTGALMREMDRRLLYFRQLAAILGSIAIVVTALLIATIVTIGVRERFGEIATLRALGIRRGRILLGIVAEGLLLAGVGCVAALPLGLLIARRLDRILLSLPGIPARMSFFAWDGLRVAAALALVALIGAAAGLVPGVHATRAALAGMLREEAE